MAIYSYAGGSVGCDDARPCIYRGAAGRCRILREAYQDRLCPFCKEKENDKMIAGYEHCVDSRPCFAKWKTVSGDTVCRILTHTYDEDGKCPFCKPEREGKAEVNRS